jgi:hypothetical protein
VDQGISEQQVIKIKTCLHPGCTATFHGGGSKAKYCPSHRTVEAANARRSLSRQIVCVECGDSFSGTKGIKFTRCSSCRAINSTSKRGRIFIHAVYERVPAVERYGFFLATLGRPIDDAKAIASEQFGEPSRFFAHHLEVGHDLGVEVAGACLGQKRMARLLTKSDAMQAAAREQFALAHAQWKSRAKGDNASCEPKPTPCQTCQWIPICADTGLACERFRRWTDSGRSHPDSRQLPDMLYDPSQESAKEKAAREKAERLSRTADTASSPPPQARQGVRGDTGQEVPV